MLAQNSWKERECEGHLKENVLLKFQGTWLILLVSTIVVEYQEKPLCNITLLNACEKDLMQSGHFLFVCLFEEKVRNSKNLKPEWKYLTLPFYNFWRTGNLIQEKSLHQVFFMRKN